ncbi:MAG: cysteine hydrolase [Desulfobacterales bacterium]|nr:cysteine hydrolase [Desulfobacterales bacterium]
MKKALIIVDIQNDYFPGGKMELVGMEAAAKNAKRVLELFRAKKMPIFHIQHISNRPGAIFFLPETDGAEIHESVFPKNSEAIVQKHFPNCFRDTSLQSQLQNLNVGEVIICGAMTHMCIDTTVRAAFDLGFRCLVVSDACATRNLEFGSVTIESSQVHAAFMAALSVPFAQVIDVNKLENHLV